MKKKKLLFLFCLIAFIATAEAPKGKSVVLVQDISPSIAPYFQTIQKVIANVLLDKRLEVGDYFTLIAFSGAPAIADGAQIQYARDIEARKAIWTKMRPEGAGTDIGLAIKTALTTTTELRNQGYSNYDPLVIFVTDGEHEPTQRDSPFFGKNVDQIFEDELIADKNLYKGWYFVGIGKNLKDIKRIAELSGRSDAFLSIDDTSKLEEALDAWLSSIPPAQVRENAEVKPVLFSVADKEFKTKQRQAVKQGKNIPVAFKLISEYEKTDAVVEILELSMTFQSSNKAVHLDLLPAFEKGKIKIPHGQTIVTTGSLQLPNFNELKGKGTLKVDLKLRDEYIDRSYTDTYDIQFLTAGEYFWKSWGNLIIVALVLIIVIVAFLLLKGFLPVTLGMELLGYPTKGRTVKFNVGDRAEVGCKPNARFRLEGNFEPVVFSIRRSGKTSWEINVRSSLQVKTTEGLNPYKIGTIIKLEDGDGNERSVRFTVKSGK